MPTPPTYTDEQIKAHRLTFIEALESGEYQQTLGALHNAEGFCCLGVGCDLYDPSLWLASGFRSFTYANSKLFMPASVEDYFGMEGKTQVSLVRMNDRGKTFREIAAYLRVLWDLPEQDG